jgi:formylglycine-generating enzyme required for sulfatase activity
LSEKRVGLVIGNGEYAKAGLLLNPVNDAKAIADALTQLHFAVTTGFDLARDPMENALFAFETQLARADVALFFFAGHGLQVKGENYLLPVDADIEIEGHLRRRAFRLHDVMHVMLERAPTSLIFLDACRNNPFTRSLARALRLESARDPMGGLAKIKIDDRYSSNSRGCLIAFATSPNKTAADGHGKNSPFVEAILKHIHSPGLSVTDMMTDVIAEVATATNDRQEPWQQSSLRTKFYFKPLSKQTRAENEAFPPALSETAIQTAAELAFWEGIKTSTDPADFRSFCERFPDSVFQELVQRRLDFLEAEDWQNIAECSEKADFEHFLEKWPMGKHTAKALTKIADIREKTAAAIFHNIHKSRNIEELKLFLSEFSSTSYAEQVTLRLNHLTAEEEAWNRAISENTILSYKRYLEQQYDGFYRHEASKEINALEEKAVWDTAVRTNTIEAFKNYRKTYPKGKFTGEASTFVLSLREKEGQGTQALAKLPLGNLNGPLLEKEIRLYANVYFFHFLSELFFRKIFTKAFKDDGWYLHALMLSIAIVLSRVFYEPTNLIILTFFMIEAIIFTAVKGKTLHSYKLCICLLLISTSFILLLLQLTTNISSPALVRYSPSPISALPKLSVLPNNSPPEGASSTKKVSRLPAEDGRQLRPVHSSFPGITVEKTSSKDCSICPEMVPIPPGKFLMGSPEGEDGQAADELPKHEVIIPKPFAIGKFEVTFAEWDAARNDAEWDVAQREANSKPGTACPSNLPDDRNWGRGNRPAICVSWNDAQAYVKWLSKKTSKAYRLPSEAEWEYAARAGTTGPFFLDGVITSDQANYNGKKEIYPGVPEAENRQMTVPVASFSPNKWGIYQVSGNVQEWVEDCWNDNYSAKPANLKLSGAAWTTGTCERRVLRGGSYTSAAKLLRSASRNRGRIDGGWYDIGFRVVRSLD